MKHPKHHAKAAHPLGNLGAFAHPAKNFAKPMKAQTRPDSPKLIGPSGDKGKHSRQPTRKT